MNSPRRIAVYAGTFDPPAAHHRRVAELLSERFDEVIVLPNGPRPDRPEAESLPVHRAVMADLNFRGVPKVRVDLSDLESGHYTPNCRFAARFAPGGEFVSHVVPASAVVPPEPGREPAIPAEWDEGRQLWDHAHFTVLHGPGEALPAEQLPPHADMMEMPSSATTEQIRADLFDGIPTNGLLVPEVADYIRRHGLFRPTPPAREGVVGLPRPPRVRLVVNTANPEACRLADQFQPFVVDDQPEVIVVLGGDGTMLRAIRTHWRERVPFYGVNTGTLGFLLNAPHATHFWERDLRLYQLPLLYVRWRCPDGGAQEALAFNDCWVERETGQTAWIQVHVNGHDRMPKVVADGMLVSTAAGSTSYARAMGAAPMPFNAALLTLAGSNVLYPEFWRPAVLPSDSTVTFTNLDPDKRPLQGFVDGVDFGCVTELTVRASNIAAVELLFAAEHDPVAKLAVLQFPHVK